MLGAESRKIVRGPESGVRTSRYLRYLIGIFSPNTVSGETKFRL
jgi:hypothetical protein